MKTLNLLPEEILIMDDALTERIMALKSDSIGRVTPNIKTLPEGRQKTITNLLNLRDKVREL